MMPGMTTPTWREHLPELVASGRFSTQKELAVELADLGYTGIHQAAVSRELHRIGAIKDGGFYAMPLEDPLPVPVHRASATAGGCLLVLKTDPAFASVLGQLVDDAAISGVLGTIAGDDTVFVATLNRAVSREVAAYFKRSLED